MSSSQDAGNSVAMREALNRVGNICLYVKENCAEKDTARYMAEAIDNIDAALAAQPRNCDVGSTYEQTVRFRRFCEIHRRHRCRKCPLRYVTNCELAWPQMRRREEAPSCEFAWAQMPYTEGEENGK